MTTSEEDDDYMSDKFTIEKHQEDIRPGLITSHSKRRYFDISKKKHELDELNRKKNPSMKAFENEKRKEGLDKPIEESNKGFSLLQRMGYKPGSGIGKNDAGRTEPISITLKSDRLGLGVLTKRKELLEKRKKKEESTMSAEEYRSRISGLSTIRQIENDLRTSQKACELLDKQNGIDSPCESWYWFITEEKKKEKKRKLSSDDESCCIEDDIYDPSEELGESEEDDEEVRDETSTTDKLYILTTYLRNTYFYCMWCGLKFDDQEDINKTCPGRTRECH